MAQAQTLALAQVSSVTGRCYDSVDGANHAVVGKTLNVAPWPGHAHQGVGEHFHSRRVDPGNGWICILLTWLYEDITAYSYWSSSTFVLELKDFG